MLAAFVVLLLRLSRGTLVLGPEGECANVGVVASGEKVALRNCRSSTNFDWTLEEVANPRPKPSFPPNELFRIEAVNHANGDKLVSDVNGRVTWKPYSGLVTLAEVNGVSCFDLRVDYWRYPSKVLNLTNDDSLGWSHAFWVYPKEVTSYPSLTDDDDMYFWKLLRPNSTEQMWSLAVDAWYLGDANGIDAGPTRYMRARHLYRVASPGVIDGDYERGIFPRAGHWYLVVIRGTFRGNTSDYFNIYGNESLVYNGETTVNIMSQGEAPRSWRLRYVEGIFGDYINKEHSATDTDPSVGFPGYSQYLELGVLNRGPGYIAAAYAWQYSLSTQQMQQLYESTVNLVRPNSADVYPFHFIIKATADPSLCWQREGDVPGSAISLASCVSNKVEQSFRMDAYTFKWGDASQHLNWLEVDTPSSFTCVRKPQDVYTWTLSNLGAMRTTLPRIKITAYSDDACTMQVPIALKSCSGDDITLALPESRKACRKALDTSGWYWRPQCISCPAGAVWFQFTTEVAIRCVTAPQLGIGPANEWNGGLRLVGDGGVTVEVSNSSVVKGITQGKSLDNLLRLDVCKPNPSFTFRTFNKMVLDFSTNPLSSGEVTVTGTATWSTGSSLTHKGVIALNPASVMRLPAGYVGGDDGFTISIEFFTSTLTPGSLLRWGHNVQLYGDRDGLIVSIVAAPTGGTFGLRVLRYGKNGTGTMDLSNNAIWTSTAPGKWVRLVMSCGSRPSVVGGPTSGLQVWVDGISVISQATCSMLRPAVLQFAVFAGSATLRVDKLEILPYAISAAQAAFETSGRKVNLMECGTTSFVPTVFAYGSSDQFALARPMMLVDENVWEVRMPWQSRVFLSSSSTANLTYSPSQVEWAETTPPTGKNLQPMFGAEFGTRTQVKVVRGGDRGEGLDLDGEFLWGWNAGSSAPDLPKVVRDVRFDPIPTRIRDRNQVQENPVVGSLRDGPESSTPFVYIGGRWSDNRMGTADLWPYDTVTPPVMPWSNTGMVFTADDVNMEDIFRTKIRMTPVNWYRRDIVTNVIELWNLAVGTTYKVQFLLTERNRLTGTSDAQYHANQFFHGWDVFLDDELVYSNLNPALETIKYGYGFLPASGEKNEYAFNSNWYNILSEGKRYWEKYGVAFSIVFTAPRTNVNVTFSGIDENAPGPADDNWMYPSLCGLTLERVKQARTISVQDVAPELSPSEDLVLRFNSRTLEYSFSRPQFMSNSSSKKFFARFTRDNFLSSCPMKHVGDNEWQLQAYTSVLGGGTDNLLYFTETSSSNFQSSQWGLTSGRPLKNGLPIVVSNPGAGRINIWNFTESTSVQQATLVDGVSSWLVSPLSESFSEQFNLLDGEINPLAKGSRATPASPNPEWVSGLYGTVVATWGVALNNQVNNVDAGDYWYPAAPALIAASTTSGWLDVEIKLKLVTAFVGSAGVVFRRLDADNFYGVALTPTLAELYKVVSGVKVSLCSTSFARFAYVPYDLTIRAVSTRLSARLATTDVCSVASKDVVDPSFIKGSIGFFGTGTTGAAFLGISVVTPSSGQALFPYTLPALASKISLVSGYQVHTGSQLPFWKLDGSSLTMQGAASAPSIFKWNVPVPMVDYVAKLKGTSSQSSLCSFGVAFHIINENNYYAMTISSTVLDVFRMVNGEKRLVSRRAKWAEYFKGDKEYELMVLSTNDTTALFVDGYKVEELYGIVPGSLGFTAVGGASCRFGDLLVTVKPGCGNSVIEPGEQCDGAICKVLDGCVCDSPWLKPASPPAPDCVDVNECASGTHDCPPEGLCVNLYGSFACAPFIANRSLQFMEGYDIATDTLNTTQGGQLVNFDLSTGTARLQAFTSLQFAFGPIYDPLRFLCATLSIDNALPLPGSALRRNVTCRLPPGAGRNLTVALRFCRLLVTGTTIPGDDGCAYVLYPFARFHYPLPRITTGTFYRPSTPSVLASNYILAQSTLGEIVTFQGEELVVTPYLRVVFSFNSSSPEYSCVVVAESTTANIYTCKTQQGGIGTDLKLQLVVGGPGADEVRLATPFRYDYPQSPVIARLDIGAGGCEQSGEGVRSCPTLASPTAPAIVTVRGKYFDAPVVVFVGSVPATLIDQVSLEELVIKLPPGNGINVPIIVSAKGQFSQSRNIVSFGAPTVTELLGCGGQKPVDKRAVILCDRVTQPVITVIGTNFGPAQARVMVGYSLSPGVTHVAGMEHTRLLVQLPQGTGLNRQLTVLQSKGLSSTSLSSISYSLCDRGYEPDGFVCRVCGGGYANNVAGAYCSACQRGLYSPAPATGAAGAHVCTLCENGKAQDQVGQSSCNVCDAGTYAPAPGRVTCLECGQGSFSNTSEAAACIECAPGKYQPDSKKTTCLPCPNGTFALTSGRQSCVACVGGTYALSGASACSVCTVGKFSLPQSADIGATSCTDCGQGKYQPGPGQAGCLNCKVGEWNTGTGKSVCAKCAKGRFNDVPGRFECTDCLPGFYANTDGLPLCIPCDSGTFANASMTEQCFSCPTGTFSVRVGGAQDSAAGSVDNTNDTAVVGADVKKQPGPEKCTACASGQFNNALQQAQCSPCDPGFYSSVTGRSICNVCQAGRFQNASGVSFCYDCKAGKYAPVAAGVSCLLCAPGTYQNASNAIGCEKCAPGKYQDEYGKTSCKSCSPGFANPAPSQVQCLICEPGFVAPLGASTDCTQCPVGSAQPSPGQRFCVFCGNGSFADTKGLPQCKACEEGFYGEGTNLTKCEPCPSGSYQPAVNQRACLNCDPGQESAPASRLCSNCPVGKIAPLTKTAVCDLCPEFSVSNAERMECVCAAGYFLARANLCDVCPDGVDCSAPGVTRLNMKLLPGYWQDKLYVSGVNASEKIVAYRCAYISFCLGGNNATCGENRVGPMCNLCAEGYRKVSGADCVVCPKQKAGALIALLTLLFIFILIGLYWFVLRTDRQILHTLDTDSLGEDDDIDVSNEARPEWRNFAHLFYYKGISKVLTREYRVGQNYLYNVKIILGFIQIVTNMTLVLDVPWPSQYTRVMRALDFLNFNIIPWDAVQCAVNVDYFTQLIVTVVSVPAGLLVCQIMLMLPMKFLDYYKFGGKAGLRRRRIFRLKYWKLVIFTLFLIYPSVSVTICQMFQCDLVNGVHYMKADYSLECFDHRWDSFLPLGMTALVIYPVGIPMIFFYFLSVQKFRLYTSSKVLYRYAFLYQAYHPDAWWFEIVDMTIKLAMTSVVGFFKLRWQMPVALAFIFVFFTTVLFWDPYVRVVDDRLQHLSCCILVNIILLGYTIVELGGKIDIVTEWVLSILLLTLQFGLFGVFIFHGSQIMYRRRKWAKRKQDLLAANKTQPTDAAALAPTSTKGSPELLVKSLSSSQEVADENMETLPQMETLVPSAGPEFLEVPGVNTGRLSQMRMSRENPRASIIRSVDGFCSVCNGAASTYCLDCQAKYCGACAATKHENFPLHSLVNHNPAPLSQNMTRASIIKTDSSQTGMSTLQVGGDRYNMVKKRLSMARGTYMPTIQDVLADEDEMEANYDEKTQNILGQIIDAGGMAHLKGGEALKALLALSSDDDDDSDDALDDESDRSADGSTDDRSIVIPNRKGSVDASGRRISRG
eukprot:gb/GEZN01000030.1/.p1 GENE.gb/GEZN01000030.1/~~gb/GEZN01000030.1/.p1  ORF type:complete len:3581 (-),score=336.49 gb/GEZN01000030.1/:465-11183(-)